MNTPLDLTRDQILAYRRRVQALDERLPAVPASLRRAAWAGLQDSMPRAAQLSIHARVEGTTPATWEDPPFVQIWGPRFSAYVIAASDVAVFSLGRMPDSASGRLRAESTAARLEAFLDGRTMTYREAGHSLGQNPNMLRYAGPTGRVLIRWEGSGPPTIRMVRAPAMNAEDARLELARRYLDVFGVATPEAFAQWAGVKSAHAVRTFEGLAGSLTPVTTPVGDSWILTSAEPELRAAKGVPAPARLLPSGDTYFLLQGADRELLVPDARFRALLWTTRVWPGAVLAGGEVVGTWRRANSVVTIESWRPLSSGEQGAVEAEAASMPLPGVGGPIQVRWEN